MMNLAPYDPDLFLRLWIPFLRRKAVAARKVVNTRKDVCTETAVSFVTSRPALNRASKRLTMAKARQRARAKGVPLTEDLDPVSMFEDQVQELTDAEALLLKQAYRKACSLVHPRAFEDVTEEAVALHAAYKAKDLKSVLEFVLAMDKTVLEQVTYWRNEALRPDIDWQHFTQTPAFQITQHLRSGADAEVLEKAILAMFTEQAVLLELSEINFKAFDDVRREGDSES